MLNTVTSLRISDAAHTIQTPGGQWQQQGNNSGHSDGPKWQHNDDRRLDGDGQ